MKTCGKCKITKELSEFHKNKDHKDGLAYYCKDCGYLNSKKWAENNKDKVNASAKRYRQNKSGNYKINFKKSYIKRRYNITLEQYNQMVEEQNNNCAICDQPETQKDPRYDKLRDLAVDHDHKTGKIRGLLCFRCNTSIGQFEDNIELFNKVIKYLKKNKGEMKNEN